MELAIGHRRRELAVEIDGDEGAVISHSPRKEQQVHRTMKAYCRRPPRGGCLPFSGLVVSEPNLPGKKMPFAGRGKQGKEPDFVCFDHDRISVVELKLRYGTDAVQQLANEVSRVWAAGRDPMLGDELVGTLRERICRKDPSLTTAQTMLAASRNELEVPLNGIPLQATLIVARPKKPGSSRVEQWLEAGEPIPLWEFRKRDGGRLADEAECELPPCTFRLLAASYLRAVHTGIGVVIDLVAIWDTASQWVPRSNLDVRAGWPVAPMRVGFEGEGAVVLGDIPDGLLGVAALWSEGDGALRSATWERRHT